MYCNNLWQCYTKYHFVLISCIVNKKCKPNKTFSVTLIKYKTKINQILRRWFSSKNHLDLYQLLISISQKDIYLLFFYFNMILVATFIRIINHSQKLVLPTQNRNFNKHCTSLRSIWLLISVNDLPTIKFSHHSLLILQ